MAFLSIHFILELAYLAQFMITLAFLLSVSPQSSFRPFQVFVPELV